MKTRSVFTTAVLIVLASVPSIGHCAEKRPLTNHELTEMAFDEFSVADKKMNAAYQQLLGILDDTGKRTLRESQRKWLAWRDAQAEFDSHQLEGGKLRPMERNGSLRQTTETRTAQLLADYKRFKN
jgi:uncharacterized protein YecT (DUF1311 family)